jgi:tetratricopeptide (TPR) repeat protein
MNDAIKLFPDDIRLYKELSDILRHNGDTAGAEKALTDARDRPLLRREYEPEVLLGRFYVATGQIDKAETTLTDALKLAPDNKKPDVQVELAQLLAGEGASLLSAKKTSDANDKFNQALGVLQAGRVDNKLIHKERVNVLVQAGRVNDAEAEIKLIVPDGPAEQSELETGYAQMELNAKHADLAVQHVNIALSANPRNASALNMRAQLKMAQAVPDIQGALQDLDLAHQIQPNDVNLLVTIANVELQAGQYDTSTKALEAALQLDPSNFTLRNRLASNYAQYPPQHLDKALLILQDGLSQPSGSTNPDLFNNIANVYQQMGKNDQALDTVTTAMQRIPSNTNGYLSLVRNYLRLSLEAENYQQVIDSASTLLEQRNDLWWAWQSRGLANARLGQRNTNQVLKDSAMADMLKALDAAKEFPDQVQVVMSISKDVDSTKAIDLVQKRLTTDPKWSTMLILLYHQVGQDDQAVKLLDPMLKGIDALPPASQVARLQLAGSIYATAQPKPFAQEAFDTYKKLLVLTPKDVQALNNFACVCADDFRPPKMAEGMEAIKTAIGILRDGNTSDPRVDDTYGWLMILNGQTTEGMDAIQRAVAHSDFPEAHYHLGEGYLRLNNPTSAQSEIAAAYNSISKAQENNEAVSASTKTNLADLSKRVLDSQKLRATGSVP